MRLVSCNYAHSLWNGWLDLIDLIDRYSKFDMCAVYIYAKRPTYSDSDELNSGTFMNNVRYFENNKWLELSRSLWFCDFVRDEIKTVFFQVHIRLVAHKMWPQCMAIFESLNLSELYFAIFIVCGESLVWIRYETNEMTTFRLATAMQRPISFIYNDLKISNAFKYFLFARFMAQNRFAYKKMVFFDSVEFSWIRFF